MSQLLNLSQFVESTQTRLSIVRKALKRAKNQHYSRPQGWGQKTESAVAFNELEAEEQGLVAMLTTLGVEVKA